MECSGRLSGAEIARTERLFEGRVPLHTLRADIDYAIVEAYTTYGRIGVKVWINKGEILNRGEKRLPSEEKHSGRRPSSKEVKPDSPRRRKESEAGE